MHLLKGMEWTPLNILKAVAIGIVLLIFASFIFSFVKSSFESVRLGGISMGSGERGMSFSVSGAPAMEQAAYDYDAASSYYYGDDGMEWTSLSARNVGMVTPSTAPLPPMGGYATGNTAEEYEVTEYSASIETQDKDETCAQVSSLKAYSYVIFDSANDYDRGCDYRFKVEHARVADVLTFIKGLNPKDLNENTYTIKDQIDDYTSETEVLENKRRSIDDTLDEALAAYDEITAIATQSGDAASLAKIIDSKIQLIERLTQERININTQLDRLARAKAEQLDRLAYTYFNVSAYERRYFDGERLGDSWKDAFRGTVNDINRILQDATLGLISLLFFAVQWIIYGLIVLFIAKHVWGWVKRIWKGNGKSATKTSSRRTSRAKSDSETPTY